MASVLADLPSTADLHTMDRQAGAPRLDAHHSYTLPELVDVAEQHNPETRVLWQQAKMRAAE